MGEQELSKLESLLKNAVDVKSAQLAVQEVNAMSMLYSENARLYFVLATLLEKSRASSSEILAAWHRAQALDCSNLIIFDRLTKALIKSGEKENARQRINSSELMKVISVDHQLVHANLLHEMKEYSESEAVFDSVISQFPESEPARILFAQRLQNRKLLVKAFEVLKPIQSIAHLGKKNAAFVEGVNRTYQLLEQFEGRSLTQNDDSGILAMKHAILHFKTRFVSPKQVKKIGKISLITGGLGPGGAERQLTRTAVQIETSRVQSQRIAGFQITDNVDVVVKSFGPEKDNDFFLSILVNHDVNHFQMKDMKSTPIEKLEIKDEQLLDLLNAVPNPAQYGLNRLVDYFRTANTEVAFIWQDGAVFFAALAALVAGVPKIVLNMRGLPPNLRAHMFRPEYYEMYKCLAQIPGVSFVSNSKVTARAYCDWLAIPETKFTVVYNGVAPMLPTPSSNDEQIWADFENLTQGSTHTVGAVFRFDTDKRPILVIRFIRKYLLKNPHARFVLVGHGRLFDQCHELAVTLKIANRVLFTGRSRSVGFWLSKMQAMVLLSRYEGLPNVLIEAQFLGVPVVSTPAGGASECFIDGETGYILSELEEPDLLEACEKVAKLIESFEQYPELERKAKDYVNELFSVPQMIENTIRALAR